MVTYSQKFGKKTKGELDFIDITRDAQEVVRSSKVRDGLLTLFVPGATAAIVVNESEKSILHDFKQAIEHMVPESDSYRHGENARSHIRAMALGPSESIPIRDRDLDMGTWQSIFLVELDVRPRNREVLARVVGTSAVH